MENTKCRRILRVLYSFVQLEMDMGCTQVFMGPRKNFTSQISEC